MEDNESRVSEAVITEAERERLVLLAEECAEVIQAATKILRWGWESTYDDGTTNLAQLRTELDDLFGVIYGMRCNNDLPTMVDLPSDVWERKKKWTYFQ